MKNESFSDSEYKNDEQSINKIISKHPNKSKNIDEYSVFNRTLITINSFNQGKIIQWEKQLNDVQKCLWNELLHTRRIKIDHSGVKVDVPRRTVRIKRNYTSESQ